MRTCMNGQERQREKERDGCWGERWRKIERGEETHIHRNGKEEPREARMTALDRDTWKMAPGGRPDEGDRNSYANLEEMPL